MKYTMLLCVLLASCTVEPGHFRPVGLTPQEEQTVAKSFNSWCTASNGSKCAVLDPKGGADVLLSNDLPNEAWGMYHQGLSKIVVRDARDTKNWMSLLQAIVMHEVGHYFCCTEERSEFVGPSAMGSVAQAVEANGVVDLEGLRARNVCPSW
jgi:hypothetical protein